MKHEYLKGVASIAIDESLCRGCGLCIEVCPHQVIEMQGDVVRVINRDACMECGACRQNCPHAVIDVSAGVGCAQAILRGMLTRKPPSCGCCDS